LRSSIFYYVFVNDNNLQFQGLGKDLLSDGGIYGKIYVREKIDMMES